MKVIKSNKEIPVYKIESLSNYCDAVDEITLEWRVKARNRRGKDLPIEPFPGELSPWFRGITDFNYECEPSILRGNDRTVSSYQNDKEKILQVQNYLYRRFRVAAISCLDQKPQDLMRWLFLMQHHGLPTRLLDWTKSSLIALFFAIRKYGFKVTKPDSAVWMLEPRKLSEVNQFGRRIPDADDVGINKFLELSQGSQYSTYPLPIIPDQVSQRLTSQLGRFTLHTHRTQGIMRFANDCHVTDNCWYIKKIKIPFKNQRNILRSLRVAGITEGQIFPDLDSISKEIKLRMSLGIDDLSESIN